MKTFVTTIFLLLSANLFSQTEFGIGTSITSSNFIGRKINDRALIGGGVLFLINQRFKKSKTSSLVFGVEYSSTMHLFQNLGNASVKIPLLYQFEFVSKKKISPVIRIGLNNRIQFNQSYGNSLKGNEHLMIEHKGGIYPMAQLNIGMRFTVNYRHSILLLLGVNKGFIVNEKINYINYIENSNKYYESDGSYFDIKVVWGIKRKLKSKIAPHEED